MIPNQGPMYLPPSGRPESRSSKQKIVKVRQELQPPILRGPERQTDNVRKLKESYEICNLRMKEMTNNNGTNLYAKVHGQRASKVYAAISSLIYATIGLTKTDGLEEFVRQTAATLPVNMVDLEEWNHVLDVAKETRIHHISTSNPQQASADDLQRKMRLCSFVLDNSPIQNMKQEVMLLKRAVVQVLVAYKQELGYALNTLHTLFSQLLEDGNGKDSVLKIAALRTEILQLTSDLEVSRKESQEKGEAVEQLRQALGALRAEKERLERQNIDLHQRSSDMQAQHQKELELLKKQSEEEEQSSTERRERENEQKLHSQSEQIKALQEKVLALEREKVKENTEGGKESKYMVAQLVGKEVSKQIITDALDTITQITLSKQVDALTGQVNLLQGEVGEYKKQLKEAWEANRELERALALKQQQLFASMQSAAQEKYSPKEEGKAAELEGETGAKGEERERLRQDLVEAREIIGVLVEQLKKEEEVQRTATEVVAEMEREIEDMKKGVEESEEEVGELERLIEQVSVIEQQSAQETGEKESEGNAEEVRNKAKELLELQQVFASFRASAEEKLRQLAAELAEGERRSAMKGEEMAKLKEQVALLEEQGKKARKRSVGFAEPLETFHKIPCALQQIQEDTSIPSLGTLPLANSAPSSSSPRVEIFSPRRSAAHYAAQKVVLDYLKEGVDIVPIKLLFKDLEEKEKVWEREPPAPSLERLGKLLRQEEVIGFAISDHENESDVTKQAEEEKKEQEDQKGLSSSERNCLQEMNQVVLVQRLIRGFLGRRKVRKIITERLALLQGVLVAYEGTKQGNTGWYTSQGQLFYFCLDKDEFLLLCGPISKDIYDMAIIEVKSLPAYQQSNVRSLPHSIALDRLALQATRIQIDTLLDDISERDEYIADIEQRVVELEQQFASKSLQLKEYEQAVNNLEQFNNELLLFKEQHSKTQLQQFHSKISRALITDEQQKHFVSLTSRVRGYLGRKRVRKLKLAKVANDTGVLVAMENTMQGESGWYLGPNGSIYYFVLKDGQWMYAAGPLTDQDFKATYLQSVHISKSISPGKLLTRCAFRLGTLASPNSELYIANRTGKLYLALSVDYLLPELMTNSLVMNNNSSINGLEASIFSGSVNSKTDNDAAESDSIESSMIMMDGNYNGNFNSMKEK